MPQRPNVSYAPPPTVSPMQAVDLNQQRQQLLLQHAQSNVTGRLGITQAKMARKWTIEQARQQRQSDLTGNMQQGVERGILGSSHEISGRIGIHGAFEQAKGQAANEEEFARTQERLRQQMAMIQLQMGLSGLDAQKAAMQATAATSEFADNTIPGSPGVGSAAPAQPRIIVPGQGGVPGNRYDIASMRARQAGRKQRAY